MTDNLQEIKEALNIAQKFIEEFTVFGGKYPQVNGTKIVGDAYKVLQEIEQLLNPKLSREEVIK